MEYDSLFCPIQSAYHPKHSTETAFLKIPNHILLALDSGKGVVLILLHMSAAFNTIDHDISILVLRLQTRFGIVGPALKLFIKLWMLVKNLLTLCTSSMGYHKVWS